jgi:putative hydrolase of the HAD superfamily
MREPAIIFDFGNVVGFFDYLKICERFGSKLGLRAEEFRERILARGFAALLAQFESGQLPPEDFAARVMEIGGLKLPYREFVAGWQDIFWLNDSVADLISRLHAAGYRLLLGSNTNVLHYAYYRRQFAPTLDLLESHIVSHEVGHQKPHPAFYAACVDKAGLPAASCVFIDDLPENVAGAKEAGLSGIVYVDTPGLMKELRALGVELGNADR